MIVLKCDCCGEEIKLNEKCAKLKISEVKVTDTTSPLSCQDRDEDEELNKEKREICSSCLEKLYKFVESLSHKEEPTIDKNEEVKEDTTNVIENQKSIDSCEKELVAERKNDDLNYIDDYLRKYKNGKVVVVNGHYRHKHHNKYQPKSMKNINEGSNINKLCETNIQKTTYITFPTFMSIIKNVDKNNRFTFAKMSKICGITEQTLTRWGSKQPELMPFVLRKESNADVLEKLILEVITEEDNKTINKNNLNSLFDQLEKRLESNVYDNTFREFRGCTKSYYDAEYLARLIVKNMLDPLIDTGVNNKYTSSNKKGVNKKNKKMSIFDKHNQECDLLIEEFRAEGVIK